MQLNREGWVISQNKKYWSDKNSIFILIAIFAFTFDP